MSAVNHFLRAEELLTKAAGEPVNANASQLVAQATAHAILALVPPRTQAAAQKLGAIRSEVGS